MAATEFSVRAFTPIGVTEDYDVTSVSPTDSRITPNIFGAMPIFRGNPFRVHLRPPDNYTVITR